MMARSVTGPPVTAPAHRRPPRNAAGQRGWRGVARRAHASVEFGGGSAARSWDLGPQAQARVPALSPRCLPADLYFGRPVSRNIRRVIGRADLRSKSCTRVCDGGRKDAEGMFARPTTPRGAPHWRLQASLVSSTPFCGPQGLLDNHPRRQGPFGVAVSPSILHRDSEILSSRACFRWHNIDRRSAKLHIRVTFIQLIVSQLRTWTTRAIVFGPHIHNCVMPAVPWLLLIVFAHTAARSEYCLEPNTPEFQPNIAGLALTPRRTGHADIQQGGLTHAARYRSLDRYHDSGALYVACAAREVLSNRRTAYLRHPK